MKVGRHILVVSMSTRQRRCLLQRCTCSELNLELCLAQAFKDVRGIYSLEAGHAETTVPAVPEDSLQDFR